MLTIEWSADHLAVLSTADDGQPRAHICEGRPGTDHANPAFTIPESAEYVRKWLDSIGIGKGKATIVLPREAVVTRRLQLPHAPENELPDMVRFQAATKTAASLDDLALDFVPIQSFDKTDEQHVMTVTVNRNVLSRMNAVFEGAGVTVETVTASPLTIARLVRGYDMSTTRQQPTLIVFQQDDRVEISILDGESLVFTHSMLLSRDSGVVNLKPLQSEITRSVVSLGQFHPNVDIEQCYYIGTHDDEVSEFLSERFQGRLHKLNAYQLMPGAKEGFEALIGATVVQPDRLLTLDLLHPRKRIEKPDLRKYYWMAGAGALALLLLLWYGMFRSQKAGLEESIFSLQEQSNDLDEQLKKGVPRLEAHQRVQNWTESDTNPITAWSKLQALLPGTDRLYLSEIKYAPQSGDVQVQFTGVGYARNRKDVDDLKTRLADNGFQVKPQPTVDSNKDPDYPVRFDLSVELMRPQPSSPAVEAPKS